MGPYEYIVKDIKGEYAYLQRTDIINVEDLFMIAVALLPAGIDIGTNLLFENLEYRVIL